MPHSTMSRSVILIPLSFLFSTITGLGQEPQFTADTEGFQKIARPYFKKHCLECHGPKKEKGDLNLETQLTNNFLDLAETAKWDEILNAVNSHEMPPEDEPQPEANETAVFADWVVKELTRAAAAFFFPARRARWWAT